MDISCNKCNSKFKIANNKIPAGKTASLTCPTCKNRISVSSKSKNLEPEQKVEKTESPPKDNTSESSFGGFVTENGYSEDSSVTDENDENKDDDSFGFVEEEGKSAIFFETDPKTIKDITSVIDFLEYSVYKSITIRGGLKKLRYNNYDLIILDENFDNSKNADTNGILLYLKRLKMLTRRNIFVVLLSRQLRTMDYMITLDTSVDLIINRSDIDKFELLLNKGLSDHSTLFRIYKESLKNTGMI